MARFAFAAPSGWRAGWLFAFRSFWLTILCVLKVSTDWSWIDPNFVWTECPSLCSPLHLADKLALHFAVVVVFFVFFLFISCGLFIRQLCIFFVLSHVWYYCCCSFFFVIVIVLKCVLSTVLFSFYSCIYLYSIYSFYYLFGLWSFFFPSPAHRYFVIYRVFGSTRLNLTFLSIYISTFVL